MREPIESPDDVNQLMDLHLRASYERRYRTVEEFGPWSDAPTRAAHTAMRACSDAIDKFIKVNIDHADRSWSGGGDLPPNMTLRVLHVRDDQVEVWARLTPLREELVFAGVFPNKPDLDFTVYSRFFAVPHGTFSHVVYDTNGNACMHELRAIGREYDRHEEPVPAPSYEHW